MASAMEELTSQFEEEKQKTRECLDDVRQLLSHETCSTRRQLIQVLQGRIDLIQAEISLDEFSAGARQSEVQETAAPVEEVLAEAPAEASAEAAAEGGPS